MKVESFTWKYSLVECLDNQVIYIKHLSCWVATGTSRVQGPVYIIILVFQENLVENWPIFNPGDLQKLRVDESDSSDSTSVPLESIKTHWYKSSDLADILPRVIRQWCLQLDQWTIQPPNNRNCSKLSTGPWTSSKNFAFAHTVSSCYIYIYA